MNFIVTQHPSLSWNLKVDYNVYNNPPWDPILSHLDQVHIFTHSFSKTHFNFNLSSVPSLPSDHTTLHFLTKILYTFFFFYTYPKHFIINLIALIIWWRMCWKPRHTARQRHNKRISMTAVTPTNNWRNVGSGVFCWVRLEAISWIPTGQTKLVLGWQELEGRSDGRQSARTWVWE
jgi:hypothetical protein